MDKVLTADAMPGYEPSAPTATPKPTTRAKRKPVSRSAAKVVPNADVKRWAAFGVSFTLVLSVR